MSGEFKILSGGNFTMNELLKLQKRGHVVVRTSHAGNDYLSNMLLYSVGVKCHLFDRNMIGKDKNYHPEYIISQGEKILIAKQKDVLLPFGEFNKDAQANCCRLKAFKNPFQTHYASLSSLFEDNMKTESNFLNENQELVSKLVYYLNKIDANLFVRSVSERGETKLLQSSSGNVDDYFLRTIEKCVDAAVGKESDFSKGLLPTVEGTIIINAVVCAMVSQKNKVFELSGPDMIKYALKKNFIARLNRLYVQLKGLMPEIPNVLTLYIVPSFYFRFGSLLSEKVEMDFILNSLNEYVFINGEKRSGLKGVKSLFKKTDARFDLQSELFCIGVCYNGDLKTLARIIHCGEVSKRMDFNLFNANHFTQYDLINQREVLYVSKKVMNISMINLEKLFQVFQISKQYL